ncbi:MAG TPA: hypothetical protein VGL61_14370 [Kofleriaceae bacterium]|jgi:hypothetical protein
MPIGIYLVIALVLPIVNGAAFRADFARHCAGVVVGVCSVVGAILLLGAGIDAVLAGVHRIANNRAARRVSSGGHA